MLKHLQQDWPLCQLFYAAVVTTCLLAGLPKETLTPAAFQLGVSPTPSQGRSPGIVQAALESSPPGIIHTLPGMGVCGQDWQQQAHFQQLVSQQAMLNQQQSKLGSGQVDLWMRASQFSAHSTLRSRIFG